MSTHENKRIVERFFTASNSGDMQTAMSLFAEDIHWTNIGTTALSGSYSGLAELQEKLLGPLFGQLKQGISMTVHRLIAEGDQVVAQCSGTAETLDGRPYNNSYCWIIRIREGKFAEVTEYLDTELVANMFG